MGFELSSPVRAKHVLVLLVAPFQGSRDGGPPTQGGAPRLRRSALPWADMWLPLSGRRINTLLKATPGLICGCPCRGDGSTPWADMWLPLSGRRINAPIVAHYVPRKCKWLLRIDDIFCRGIITMTIPFHLARLHFVLLLGLLLTLACAPGEAPSVVADAAEGTGAAHGSDPAAEQPPKKSELLIRLPQGCNTPDGMALLPDGSFVLSVPNFNDLQEGARLMRITADNKAETFIELPDHPVTGQPVGALGVCLAPSGDLFLADYQMTGERQSRVLKIVMKDGQPMDIQPVITGFHVSNAVICRDGFLFVSETQIDIESKPATSGVYRFPLETLANGPSRWRTRRAKTHTSWTTSRSTTKSFLWEPTGCVLTNRATCTSATSPTERCTASSSMIRAVSARTPSSPKPIS